MYGTNFEKQGPVIYNLVLDSIDQRTLQLYSGVPDMAAQKMPLGTCHLNLII